MDEFKEKVYELTEHNEYVVRNNLNNLLINAVPEVVDIYIELILDLIMDQENSMHEEICEILMQLNVNDLNVLQMIKNFERNGVKKEYLKSIERENEIEANNKEVDLKNAKIDEYNKTEKIKKIKLNKYYERNFKMEEKTIFWNDFIEKYELESGKLSQTLLFKTIDETNKESLKWAYIGRSFLKLERLGIIQMDYLNTPGTINSLNIDRFHITLFGEKLLNYIK